MIHQATEVRRFRRLAGASTIVGVIALAAGCGDPEDKDLSGSYYMCLGTYTKTDQNGALIGPANQTLIPDSYCGRNTASGAPKQNSACTCATSVEDAVTKCSAQLASGRSGKDPDDASITWNFSYNVTSADVALSIQSERCDPNGNTATVTQALIGGPAQYSALLTGSVYMSADDYHDNGTTSGRVDYTVDGRIGNCPTGGCSFAMTRFMGTASDMDVYYDFTGISFANAGEINGKVQNDGSIQIPASAMGLTINFNRDGNHNSRSWANSSTVTGHLSSDGKLLTLDTINIGLEGASIVLSNLTTGEVSPPPVAVINPSSISLECTSPAGAAVHLDATASTGGNGEFYWKIDDGAYVAGAGQLDTTLALGSHRVKLAVPNALEGIGYATSAVTIVDTTPPALTAGTVTTVRVCDVGLSGVTLMAPTITDSCSGVRELTGKVISTNGQTLSTPIDLVDGHGYLPVGQHVVVWEAVDNAGNHSTLNQTVSVIPSFYATAGFYLPDGAKLRTPLSDRTPFANASGQAQLGVEATSGEIWSGGSVWLRDRAHVYGKVYSAGAITPQNGVITDGLYPYTRPFYLAPPLQRSAPMPGGGPAVSLEPDQTRTLVPGSYGDLSVKSRSILKISAGTYNFTAAMLEPDSVLEVSGDTTIVIGTNFTYRGKVNYVGSAKLTIIYLGTSTAYIERYLKAADLYAPNAKVVLGVAGVEAYVGAITARQIEAAPRATILCDI